MVNNYSSVDISPGMDEQTNGTEWRTQRQASVCIETCYQWWHSKSRGKIGQAIKDAEITGYAHGKLDTHHTAN